MTLPLRVYVGLTAVMPWVMRHAARRAHQRMQAPPGRLGERLGTAFAPRPEGRLFWFNAASVGEAGSALSIAQTLAKRCDAHILMTTTTQSAAQMLAKRAPDVVHQFQPMDTLTAAGAFLDHWRPDLACFMENDLWPNLMGQVAARNIPMAVLNARVSKTRRRLPRSVGAVLAPVALISTQDARAMDELKACGIDAAVLCNVGDLKAVSAPLPKAGALSEILQARATGRPVWAAVSTHPGEETIIAAAHREVLEQLPEALLLLVPRHPDRGAQIAQELTEQGLRVTRRSANAHQPEDATQVYLIDTLGETGPVYAHAPVAFVAGSFAKRGGHNPYEAIAGGGAVLHGPHVTNFQTAYDLLSKAGAARAVTPQTLGNTVLTLLQAPQECADMATRGAQALTRQTADVSGLIDRLAELAA